MCEIILYRKEHLLDLLDQPINRSIKDWALGPGAAAMESEDSITILYKGQVMVCGGVSKIWEGRGIIWSIFSEDSKIHFVATYRAIRRWLCDMQKKYARIEMSVDYGFFQGCRRAELLGFEIETVRAKRYTPSGNDCSIYSLIRKD